MQMMPATAQDRNVGIPDIHLAEPNIDAGVKYLRFLGDQYFDEPRITPTDRLQFAFAACNAGPNRGNIYDYIACTLVMKQAPEREAAKQAPG
jgi:membrane-bound lytic murein transglycosylase MltF